MENDLISRSALTACVVNTPSKVCQDAPYDHVWFTRLVDREQEILDMIENAPAVDAVEVDKAMTWLEGYTMTDTKQIYSNGTVFVPLYRVKQAFVDKVYNGLQEG